MNEQNDKSIPHGIEAAKFIDFVNFYSRDESKRSRILLAEVLLRVERLENFLTPSKMNKGWLKSDLHPTQIKIIEVSKSADITKMTLRELGSLVGAKHPQQVYHHIKMLKKRGFLE